MNFTNSGKQVSEHVSNQQLSDLSKLSLPINGYIPANSYNLMNAQQNHFQNIFNALEIYRSQYFRLLRQNQLLKTQLNSFIIQQIKSQGYNDQNQKKYQETHKSRNQNQHKIKRYRRSAKQIERNYTCFSETCSRSYGTQASLIQHIKIKHPQILNTKNYEQHMMSIRRQYLGVSKEEAIQNQIDAEQEHQIKKPKQTMKIEPQQQ